MKQKFTYIDSLRGWAILAVVFIHTAYFGGMDYLPNTMVRIAYCGQYGVALFFVLSAFTLFHSLKHRSTFAPERYSWFLIRRFFRIAPMYYLGIIYYSFDRFVGFRFFLNGLVRQPVPTGSLISNIFFVNGLDPVWINGIVPGGWSIAVEMSFYLLVPFLFKTIKSFNQSLIFLTMSLLLYLVSYFAFRGAPSWNQEWFYMSLFSQLPIFAIGCSTYFFAAEKKPPSRPSIILTLLFTLWWWDI